MDPNTRRLTRAKHVSFENNPTVPGNDIPGKRTRRTASLYVQNPSMNAGSSKASKETEKTTAAKRKRRCDSTPSLVEQPDDALSKLVSMNCKLTNEILIAKKQFIEKTDVISKLQDALQGKTIENKDMQNTIAELMQKIKELERCIEQLRSERFCDDLIDFEGNKIPDFGKINVIFTKFISNYYTNLIFQFNPKKSTI